MGSGFEGFEEYLKAGEIAYRVKKSVAKYVKPNVKLLEIANYVEKLIKDLGGEPAFPANISINEVAAHRSPYVDDVAVVPENSLVKIDVGVHVNGYIADTAITISFNDKYLRLVEAVQEALNNALKIISNNIQLNAIGRVIERTVKSYGYNVVRNLSGHSLGRYLIHAGEIVPNNSSFVPLGKVSAGKAYAVEPFATDGRGYVQEDRNSIQIYALSSFNFKNLNDEERELAEYIFTKFKTLPFCERWLVDKFNDYLRLRDILKKLTSKKVLTAYPVLVESSKGYVAQYEETVLILKDKVYITTNPEIQ
ncbi:MAG: type II methionyl aminopeptidase [Zestosphaera tikiterensis]|uniref:Methionine aminopeptidase n=1 Tax=Zestosphaera tikiterensis TaxID=1973259 RepID=A0A2R7Y7F3_9CREN|nr:MAG: type II methionyl aminopeptidase [Zestosphaera tikiterensis]